MSGEIGFSLLELERRTGLGRRRIRHYIQSGLVVGSASRGPGAKYGQATLHRLELIGRLKSVAVAPLGRPLRNAEILAVLESRGETGLAWLAESRSLLSADLVPQPKADSKAEVGRELEELLASLRDELRTLLAAERPGDPGWERWLRLRRPDLELHLRAPANSSERRRLIRLAEDLTRLLGC